MEDNIDIFIGTIKDEENYPKNPIYKLLCLGGTKLNKEYGLEVLHDNTGDNISIYNKFMCEWTGMYWVWKNYPLKDYVGFCQYRRYFEFFDDVPDMEDIFKEHDIVLFKPAAQKPDTLTSYRLLHNVSDILLITSLIVDKYPSYAKTITSFFNCKAIFPNNSFIMRKEKFIQYCEWMNDAITLFMKNKSILTYDDCIKRVIENEKTYLKTFSPNDQIEYQARFLAYLIERMTNLFIINNFSEPYMVDIKLTEKKYTKEQSEEASKNDEIIRQKMATN